MRGHFTTKYFALDKSGGNRDDMQERYKSFCITILQRNKCVVQVEARPALKRQSTHKIRIKTVKLSRIKEEFVPPCQMPR